MKNDYKISVGVPKLSDEQIDRHRDFESVLQKYNSITQPLYRRPLYKNPKAFLGLVLILVVGALVFIAVKEERVPGRYVQDGEHGDMVFKETPMVNPLMPRKDLPVITLNTTADARLELGDGMVLNVPKGAFGPNAPANISLNVRLLAHPADRVAAGIPSQSDKDGYLHSVALFDLRAHGPQGELALEKGMALTLEWTAAGKADPAERLYFLDEVNRKWIAVSSPIQYQNREVEAVEEVQREKSDGFQVLPMTDSGGITKPAQRQNNLAKQGKAETLLVRTLMIDRMGVWEVAVPNQLGERKTAKVKFQDANGQALEFSTIYVISQGVEAVFTAWNTVSDPAFELVYDASRANKAIGVTSDGKFGVMGPAAFKALKDGELQAVTMTLLDKEIETPEQLSQLLSFDGPQTY